MDHIKIINYIKIREQWKDATRAKNKSLTSAWRGLIEFGFFLTYYAIENYFLTEEIANLYVRNPKAKYLFHVSLLFGCWGIITSLLGVYYYFQHSQQVKQLEQQIELIEKDILE